MSGSGSPVWFPADVARHGSQLSIKVAATKHLPATTAAAERAIMAVSLITNQTEPRFLRGTTASSHAELYVISNEQLRGDGSYGVSYGVGAHFLIQRHSCYISFIQKSGSFVATWRGDKFEWPYHVSFKGMLKSDKTATRGPQPSIQDPKPTSSQKNPKDPHVGVPSFGETPFLQCKAAGVFPRPRPRT